MIVVPGTFHLIFRPGTRSASRTAFTISQADIDAAIEYGRARRGDRLENQLEGAAYHMIVNLRVCPDDRIFELPWVVVCDDMVIARYAVAARVQATNLS